MCCAENIERADASFGVVELYRDKKIIVAIINKLNLQAVTAVVVVFMMFAQKKSISRHIVAIVAIN
jgi:hypothetical protein